MTVVYLKKSFWQKEECLSSEIIPVLICGAGDVLFPKFHSLEQLTGKVAKEKSIGGPRIDILDKSVCVR